MSIAPEKNWTTVGADLVARVGGRDAVVAKVATLDWEAIPKGGALTVGACQGYAINAAISELGLPGVTLVAPNGAFSIQEGEEGFYPGFYGIEAHYTNGRARVYLLDTGCEVVPLLTEFWPADRKAA